MNSFPAWRNVGNGFLCDDDDQNMYAFACEFMYGFDLPRFDLWAATLPDCPKCGSGNECCLKQEMRDRRQYAIEALQENNKDAALRHLEWMLNRQRMDSREQFLLPLARTGDAAKTQRSKAGFNSGEERRAERKPEWDEWQRLADEVWKANPRLSIRDVAKSIEKKLAGSLAAASSETIRRRIRKP